MASYVCDLCGFQSDDRAAILSHVRDEHQVEDPATLGSLEQDAGLLILRDQDGARAVDLGALLTDLERLEREKAEIEKHMAELAEQQASLENELAELERDQQRIDAEEADIRARQRQADEYLSN